MRPLDCSSMQRVASAQLRHNLQEERFGDTTTNRARRCWQYDNIAISMDIMASRFRMVRFKWQSGLVVIACVSNYTTRWGRAFALYTWKERIMIRTTTTCCTFEGNYTVDVLKLSMPSPTTPVSLSYYDQLQRTQWSLQSNQSEISSDLLLSFSSSSSIDDCVFSSAISW